MCGIAGYAGNVNQHRTRLQVLWLLLQERGLDASGAFWNRGKKPWYAKRAGSPVAFLSDAFNWWSNADYVMLHCRQATSGLAAINTNNHPILAHGWAVMHNGIIWNDEVPKAERVSDCDSEAINWMAKKHGIRNALTKELLGWFTISAVELKHPDTLYLYTESNALHLARTTDGIAWASEARFLEIARYKNIEPAKKGVLYIIKDGVVTEKNIGLPELSMSYSGEWPIEYMTEQGEPEEESTQKSVTDR